LYLGAALPPPKRYRKRYKRYVFWEWRGDSLGYWTKGVFSLSTRALSDLLGICYTSLVTLPAQGYRLPGKSSKKSNQMVDGLRNLPYELRLQPEAKVNYTGKTETARRSNQNV